MKPPNALYIYPIHLPEERKTLPTNPYQQKIEPNAHHQKVYSTDQHVLRTQRRTHSRCCWWWRDFYPCFLVGLFISAALFAILLALYLSPVFNNHSDSSGSSGNATNVAPGPLIKKPATSLLTFTSVVILNHHFYGTF